MTKVTDKMLQLLVDSMPGIVYWKSSNLHYLGANKQFLNFIGLNTTDELVGKKDAELPCSLAQQEYLGKGDLQVLVTEQSQCSKSKNLLTPDGKEITLLTDKHPLYDENNKVIGVLCLSRIEESKPAAIQVYLESIIASVPCYIFWKDINSIYLGCNQKFSNLVKKNPEEVIGCTDFQLGWKPGDAEFFVESDQAVMSGKTYINVEETLIHPDGLTEIILVSKVPIHDLAGSCIGILGIFIDITEQKKIEAQLGLAKASEIANQVKTEFIANMSHDIRTPLVGVMGMSKLLEDYANEPNQKQYAQWIGQSAAQLLHMLNGILDVIAVDNINSSDLHEESFNLHHAIENIIELERPSTLVKGISLNTKVDTGIPPCVISDPTKIHRILLNLLSNAIKFTQVGEVRLEVKLLQQSTTHVFLQFLVIDTGIGIPSEFQNKVFDRFFRVTPSYKGTYSGNGLGLHIAQSYAYLLGSKINLISEPGVETTFSFDLSLKIGNQPPLLSMPALKLVPSSPRTVLQALPPTQACNSTHLKDTPSEVPNLLLIEDNYIALLTLENLVTRAGCRFTSAMDGETALNLAQTQSFDLIITDLGLPGLSGIDLTRLLREFEKKQQKKHIPIIGLTAHAEEKIKKDCLQSGMNEALTKPINPEALEHIKLTYLSLDTFQSIKN